MSNIFCFDIESNGSKQIPSVLHEDHHIIQLAVMHIASQQKFQSLVKLPEGVLIPQESSNIHGIYECDIENSPYWKTVFYNLKKWVKQMTRGVLPVVFIGHNCHGFDEPLFRKECITSRRQVPLDWLFFDSLSLIKHMMPERGMLPFDRRYNLGSLHKDIVGYELSGAHDAMADVIGLCNILERIGVFNGAVNFNDITHIGYNRSSPVDLSQPLTSIRGIGPHTSRLIAHAIYKSNATVQDLYLFVSHRSIHEVEQFLRTVSTHEKHVLSLTILLWKMVHNINIETEIHLVNQFPFTHDGSAFHNMFTAKSIRNLQKAGYNGILDLCVLDNYKDKDLICTLQALNCSDFEIIKFRNNYKKLL